MYTPQDIRTQVRDITNNMSIDGSLEFLEELIEGLKEDFQELEDLTADEPLEEDEDDFLI